MDIKAAKKATKDGIGIALISLGVDMVVKGETLMGAVLILVGWGFLYFGI